MAKITDPTYLQNKQYQNASNLDARFQLHARFSTNSLDLFLNKIFDV